MVSVLPVKIYNDNKLLHIYIKVLYRFHMKPQNVGRVSIVANEYPSEQMPAQKFHPVSDDIPYFTNVTGLYSC